MAHPTIPGDSVRSIDDDGQVTLVGGEEATVGPDGTTRTARVGGDDDRLPEQIGRHAIERVLGRGGMGVVFAAHDPELDRPIAIKLVDRLPSRADAATQASARMKREAQAMAKLNHRNVISVYDVGEHGEQLYIAMELVDGCSLRDWVRREPRPEPDAIIEAYVQAGEGLAAAHRAGLAHRDFKPENAMRGSDGVVRVLDFGLAQPAGERLVSEAEPSTIELSSPCVTRTGAVVGTPAYMAPEQFEGQAADARSDQFSFCVSMWEALYGERPFPGSDLAALAFSVTSGELRLPKSSRGVPKWIRRVLLRGLATQPEERWPSMKALLGAIGARRRGGRRWVVPAAVVVTLASTTAAGYALWEANAEVCAGGDQALAGAWDDARREAVARAFHASEVSFAATELQRVSERLDRYAERWGSVQVQACEATRVHGTQSEEALDREMACLHERRARLRSLVTELERGKLIEGAAMATQRLPSPEACADLEGLQHVLPVPDDPQLAEQVAIVRDRMADASAMTTAGRFEEAREIVDAALEEAERIGFDPLVAEVLDRKGVLLEKVGELDEARQTLERAFNLALGSGHDAMAHECAGNLLFIVGVQQQKLEEGRRWLASARATLKRADLGVLAEVRLAVDEADLLLVEGKFADAAELAVKARELLKTEVEDGAPEYVDVNEMEAQARARLGELEAARALFERNLEIAAKLGDGHPDMPRALTNLGVVEHMSGNLQAARDAFERALPLREAYLGPKHDSVASILNNIGGAAYEMQDYEAAKTAHERALEIRLEQFGERHGAVAQSLHNLGNAYAGMGDDEAAVRHAKRAIEIREEVLGPEHPVVASTLGNLANSYSRMGRGDEALAAIERAIAIREKTLGPEHPDVGYSLTAKGEVLVNLERWADAVPPLARALEIREKAEYVDPALMGATKLQLSRALWHSGGDKARARELAKQAQTHLQGAERSRPKDIELVNAWVAEID